MAASGKPPKPSILWTARIVTTIVSIAGAEGMLWISGYPSWLNQQPVAERQSEYATDPELGWKNREGVFDLASPFGTGSFRYTNWSDGRRATSLHPPSASLPQVVFTGDSYVQGYGLSDAQTLPWIYQQRHPELAVSNFGTSFYGTYQPYLGLQRALRSPAKVYYLFNGFHEGRNVADAGWLRVIKAPPDGFFFPYATLDGEQIENHRGIGQMVWSLSWHSRLIAMAEEYKEMAEAYPRVRRKRQITQELLVKMDQTARAAGGSFTVILFDLEKEDYQPYAGFLAAHHIAYIGGDRPELKDASLRLPDGHPNQKMNELLATWIDESSPSANAKR